MHAAHHDTPTPAATPPSVSSPPISPSPHLFQSPWRPPIPSPLPPLPPSAIQLFNAWLELHADLAAVAQRLNRPAHEILAELRQSPLADYIAAADELADRALRRRGLARLARVMDASTDLTEQRRAAAALMRGLRSGTGFQPAIPGPRGPRPPREGAPRVITHAGHRPANAPAAPPVAVHAAVAPPVAVRAAASPPVAVQTAAPPAPNGAAECSHGWRSRQRPEPVVTIQASDPAPAGAEEPHAHPGAPTPPPAASPTSSAPSALNALSDEIEDAELDAELDADDNPQATLAIAHHVLKAVEADPDAFPAQAVKAARIYIQLARDPPPRPP